MKSAPLGFRFQFELEQVTGFGTARGLRGFPMLLVKGITAFVQRIHLRLAFFFFIRVLA
jgi:hypothetical protein